MASNSMKINTGKSNRELLERFPEPSQCLAAHLMYETSEVLAGVKPANLIPLVNRTRSCGRNLYDLWKYHREEAVSMIPGIEFVQMRCSESSVLLFCFNRASLERHLSHQGISSLLEKSGYSRDNSFDEKLAELARRVGLGGDFPHEIGLFLGYPAKDVAAFMGYVRLPFRCQALWKIYGRPDESLRLAEDYRICRKKMGSILEKMNSLDREEQNKIHAFFCHANDNSNQLHRKNG